MKSSMKSSMKTAFLLTIPALVLSLSAHAAENEPGYANNFSSVRGLKGCFERVSRPTGKFSYSTLVFDLDSRQDCTPSGDSCVGKLTLIDDSKNALGPVSYNAIPFNPAIGFGAVRYKTLDQSSRNFLISTFIPHPGEERLQGFVVYIPNVTDHGWKGATLVQFERCKENGDSSGN